MVICVYAAAGEEMEKLYFERVEALGKRMAQRGHSLVFGAGGTGLMGAIAKGFGQAGAKVKGVIPTFFVDNNIEIVSKHCNEVIYTEDMRDRKEEMENSADAFVTVPGGIGTFEEFFEILTLKQLRRHSKPIVLYNILGYYDELVDFINLSIEKGFIKPRCRELFCVFDDADKLIDYLESYKDEGYSIKELKA